MIEKWEEKAAKLGYLIWNERRRRQYEENRERERPRITHWHRQRSYEELFVTLCGSAVRLALERKCLLRYGAGPISYPCSPVRAAHMLRADGQWSVRRLASLQPPAATMAPHYLSDPRPGISALTSTAGWLKRKSSASLPRPVADSVTAAVWEWYRNEISKWKRASKKKKVMSKLKANGVKEEMAIWS